MISARAVRPRSRGCSASITSSSSRASTRPARTHCSRRSPAACRRSTSTAARTPRSSDGAGCRSPMQRRRAARLDELVARWAELQAAIQRAVARRDGRPLPRGAAPVRSLASVVRPVGRPAAAVGDRAPDADVAARTRASSSPGTGTTGRSPTMRARSRGSRRGSARSWPRELGLGRPRPVGLPREPVRASRPAVRARGQPARRRVPPRPPGHAGMPEFDTCYEARAHAARGARADPGAVARDGGARAGCGRASREGVPDPDRHRPRALSAANAPRSGPRQARGSGCPRRRSSPARSRRTASAGRRGSSRS